MKLGLTVSFPYVFAHYRNIWLNSGTNGSISSKTMDIPGAYPDEHPILAVWTEGGHIHAHWSCWTVHKTSKGPDSYLLRHVEGFESPFKTTECELPAATYGGVVERLEAVSIVPVSWPDRVITEATYAGVAYYGGGAPIRFRWYGVAPSEWGGLARWHSDTCRIFERVMQQTLL